jgi:hypothetical protein
MGKVILLPQPLHPFKGCLRIEHENKNVSIDTLKLKLKLNELLLKTTTFFWPTYPFMLSAPIAQQELYICCVILCKKIVRHSRTDTLERVTVSNT